MRPSTWVLGVAALLGLGWGLRERLRDLAMRTTVGTNVVTIHPSEGEPAREVRT